MREAMKGAVKSRFLKKLKSIKSIEALKQGRVIQVSAASDGWLDRIFQDPNQKSTRSSLECKEQDERANHQSKNLPVMEPDIVYDDVSELLRDLEDEEMELFGGDDVGNKENIGPSSVPKANGPLGPTKGNSENLMFPEPVSQNQRILHKSSCQKMAPAMENSENSVSAEPAQLAEIDVSSFRRPDMNSGSLFDPKLLMAFEQAVMEHMRAQEEDKKDRAEKQKLRRIEEEKTVSEDREVEGNPLLEFEEKCPPGGSESVILYTTSLRGIRKTFEDCSSIRFLLGSFRIVYYERDVSMHLEFREELWRILGGRVVPPRLFIKGRYIGGADEVVGLHEQGKLLKLFQGIPRDGSNGPCRECGGVHFVLCFNCDGSCKVNSNEGDEDQMCVVQCPDCNENGLIVCPFCC